MDLHRQFQIVSHTFCTYSGWWLQAVFNCVAKRVLIILPALLYPYKDGVGKARKKKGEKHLTCN